MQIYTIKITETLEKLIHIEAESEVMELADIPKPEKKKGQLF